MKTFFIQYKPFFIFLAKFFLFYLVFAFTYKVYLNQYEASKYEVDSITELVSHQTVKLLQFFDQEAITFKHESESSFKVFFREKYISRIVEGCNAVSVIILFAAFIFAFSSTFKKTFLFIVFGAALIYFLNVVRIALLIYALYYYPQYGEVLHDVAFPLFIYGVVFILWIFWVVKISGYEKVD